MKVSDDMAVTLESIKEKLGFDPFNPPKILPENPFEVDDHRKTVQKGRRRFELH